MKKNVLVVILLFYFYSISAQSNVLENLSSHVYFLADDRLEGRATGSKGAEIARSYIASEYIEIGLKPLGENGFIQAFDFTLGKKLLDNNFLTIGDKSLILEDDYFPLVYSKSENIQGALVNVGFGIESENYSDYKNKPNLTGKIFAINLSSPDGIHPHSKYKDYTEYRTRIKKAKEKGAIAVVFFNTDKHVEDPYYDIKRNVQNVELPVVFVQRTLNDLLKDGENIALSVNMAKDKRVGKNVIGFIDNEAENTIIIGAHYDHLGWGEDGGSLYKGKPAIHNGADDNASGVSTIIELARKLKNSKATNNNYLFIAFSAEEVGLIGSKSFLLNPTLDLSKVNYMINLDMVGRLDKNSKNISIGGVGTSPVFLELIKNGEEKGLNIIVKKSGMGPSDHASFYMKDIPVLFMFTGTHSDYHKPSDDSWKLNYKGMNTILNYSFNLISEINDRGKLEFFKTKEPEKTSGKRKFSVTLGVVPNYMYDGKGMKIDGVSDGRPAFKAGILAGDIVVKMGDIEILDMMSYMTALGKFKKGNKTIVEVLRDGKIVKTNVEF